MRDAPVLVLDEPTSALDAQAENDLFTRLRELAKGRTTLYISHRFSTVRQAEKIILMAHGKLAEEGTHEELMELGGDYAELFTLQAAAYAHPSPTTTLNGTAPRYQPKPTSPTTTLNGTAREYRNGYRPVRSRRAGRPGDLDRPKTG
jgi:ABC-type multidrug transport system ATPase subunit